MTDQPRTPEQQEAFEVLVREIKELRPLPAVARRLLVMAADRRFSSQDLADTVSADQALTLKILRLANSPTFGLPRRITTLREAIVLLGFREVRSMALAACVIDATDADLMRGALLEYERFWQNSVIVGMLAQVLAEAEGCDREEAFTAGVVHNVGRLALAQRRPDWLRVAIGRANSSGQTIHEAQQHMFGFTDADIGGAMARNWSFPERLCAAVEHHAKPLSFFEGLDELDAIVARSRRHARAYGVTDGIDVCSKLSPDSDWQRPKVVNAMRLVGGFEGILERAGSFLHARAA